MELPQVRVLAPHPHTPSLPTLPPCQDPQMCSHKAGRCQGAQRARYALGSCGGITVCQGPSHMNHLSGSLEAMAWG